MWPKYSFFLGLFPYRIANIDEGWNDLAAKSYTLFRFINSIIIVYIYKMMVYNTSSLMLMSK